MDYWIEKINNKDSYCFLVKGKFGWYTLDKSPAKTPEFVSGYGMAIDNEGQLWVPGNGLGKVRSKGRFKGLLTFAVIMEFSRLQSNYFYCKFFNIIFSIFNFFLILPVL